jgi:hypothetical protein
MILAVLARVPRPLTLGLQLVENLYEQPMFADESRI